MNDTQTSNCKMRINGPSLLQNFIERPETKPVESFFEPVTFHILTNRQSYPSNIPFRLSKLLLSGQRHSNTQFSEINSAQRTYSICSSLTCIFSSKISTLVFHIVKHRTNCEPFHYLPFETPSNPKSPISYLCFKKSSLSNVTNSLQPSENNTNPVLFAYFSFTNPSSEFSSNNPSLNLLRPDPHSLFISISPLLYSSPLTSLSQTNPTPLLQVNTSIATHKVLWDKRTMHPYLLSSRIRPMNGPFKVSPTNGQLYSVSLPAKSPCILVPRVLSDSLTFDPCLPLPVSTDTVDDYSLFEENSSKATHREKVTQITDQYTLFSLSKRCHYSKITQIRLDEERSSSNPSSVFLPPSGLSARLLQPLSPLKHSSSSPEPITTREREEGSDLQRQINYFTAREKRDYEDDRIQGNSMRKMETETIIRQLSSPRSAGHNQNEEIEVGTPRIQSSCFDYPDNTGDPWWCIFHSPPAMLSLVLVVLVVAIIVVVRWCCSVLPREEPQEKKVSSKREGRRARWKERVESLTNVEYYHTNGFSIPIYQTASRPPPPNTLYQSSCPTSPVNNHPFVLTLPKKAPMRSVEHPIVS